MEEAAVRVDTSGTFWREDEPTAKSGSRAQGIGRTLTQSPGGLLHLQRWVKPKSAAGLAVIPVQVGLIGGRRFSTCFEKYDSSLD